MSEEGQPKSRLSNQSKVSILPKSLSQDRLPTAQKSLSNENPAEVYQLSQHIASDRQPSVIKRRPSSIRDVLPQEVQSEQLSVRAPQFSQQSKKSQQQIVNDSALMLYTGPASGTHMATETTDRYFTGRLKGLMSEHKENKLIYEFAQDVITHQNAMKLNYIISQAGDAELNLDKVVSHEHVMQLRDDYLKSKIKKQLHQIMNSADVTNRARQQLPDLLLDKEKRILDSYQSIESLSSARHQNMDEFKQKQLESQQFLRQLRLDKKKRQQQRNMEDPDRFKKSQFETTAPSVIIEEEHTDPRPEELKQQMKDQRRRYLEIKEEERRLRKEAISSSLGKSNSPNNHSVLNTHRRAVPLYKQLEENFHKNHEEEEREKYQKAIEERKRIFSNPTISVNNLRQHWEEYKQQIQTNNEVIQKKRVEERKKSKEISKWLSHNIKRTKFHSIVETEITPVQEEMQHRRKRNQLMEQQDQYAKVVKQVHPPKVSEKLALETERRIKLVEREEFKKRKIEIVQAPYKDYFKEGMKKAAVAQSTRVASIPDESGNLLSDIMRSNQETPLRSVDRSEPLSNQNQVRIKKQRKPQPHQAYTDHVSDTQSVAASKRNPENYLRQFRSKEDENPQDRRFKELKREIDQSLQKGDTMAFNHAQFKLREMENQIQLDEKNTRKIGNDDDKKNQEINRRMLKALDAKLAILENF